MQNIAYSDRTATLQLGTWTFVMPIMFLRVFISAFFLIIALLTGSIKAQNAYKRIANGVFFKGFIAMSIEGLFCYIIVSYLNLRKIEFTTFGECMGSALSLYCISFSLIILPSIQIYILLFKKYE